MTLATLNDPPRQLGRYRIVSEIGRGAMGVVYKAEDPLLNRMVAVKTILLSATPSERLDYEKRFTQEARAAGGLNHPNIIITYDVGREGDLAWLAMELLEGVELRDRLTEERIPPALALDIAIQVADGIAHAHEQGVVHRDIKPTNVMLVRPHAGHAGQYQAKLMDFGIARMRVSDIATQTGLVLGSPKYMAPEQVKGQRADHRSDIFALGVVTYEMIAGLPPFSGADIHELMFDVCENPHKPLSRLNPALPAMLDLIVDKALAKAADARYQSAAEFAADLRTCRAELAKIVPKPFDIGAGTTIPNVAPPLDPTVTLERAAAPQLSRSGSFAAQANGRSGDVRFIVSRKLDSSAALLRLEGEVGDPADFGDDSQAEGRAPERAAAAAQRKTRKTQKKPVRDTERLLWIAGFGVAVIAAVAIAFR